MALITCMSPSRRGSKATEPEQEVLPQDWPAVEPDEDHTHDDDDSGCECSLEELEGMDTWTKTLVAIRVLTAFKKRRKKRLEDEQKEKAKKERRKTLWRRLGFKLRIFNMFARKISSDDPAQGRIIKLKRKLGDFTVESEEEAYRYQRKIEESLEYQLGFNIKVGDTILTIFDNLPGQSGRKRGRRKSKVFERTHSFDDSNPRAARNGRQPVQSDNNFVQGGRRRSWHNEQSTNFSTIFDTSDRKSPVHIAPIVIISTPESDETPIPDPVSSLTISPENKPAPSPPTSTDLNQDIHHNKKDRRPSIVKRNFRKIFGK